MTDDDKRAAERFADNYYDRNAPGQRESWRDVVDGYLAGLKARDEQLLKQASEFDEAGVDTACFKYCEWSGDTHGDGPAFMAGARWQHEQGRLREAALRNQLAGLQADHDLLDEALMPYIANEVAQDIRAEQAIKERDAALAEVERLKGMYNRRYSENLENDNAELRQERDRLKKRLEDIGEK